MFDLSLFRKPTFVGGLIAAFAISASLFSQFPYLVIYMQAGLGLSAIDIGVRFLVLSGPIFITAAIAGRLTEKVPTRFLIGPGFLFVGIAQLLMRGLEPGSDWTHFIPGFLVAGIGAGLHQRAAGAHRGRRGRAGAGGDGERDQLDAAPGRHRHRRRRAGRDLLPPRASGAAATRWPGSSTASTRSCWWAAILALVAAATSLVLIRSKDFVRVANPP